MDTDTPPQIPSTDKPTEAQLAAMTPSEQAMHLTGQASEARIEEARQRLEAVQAQMDEQTPPVTEGEPQQPTTPPVSQ